MLTGENQGERRTVVRPLDTPLETVERPIHMTYYRGSQRRLPRERPGRVLGGQPDCQHQAYQDEGNCRPYHPGEVWATWRQTVQVGYQGRLTSSLRGWLFCGGSQSREAVAWAGVSRLGLGAGLRFDLSVKPFHSLGVNGSNGRFRLGDGCVIGSLVCIILIVLLTNRV